MDMSCEDEFGGNGSVSRSAVGYCVSNVFCYPGVVTNTLQVLWQALTYRCNAITVACKDFIES